MDYYRILNLRREPFSNSPDPDYFFNSRSHFSCLQKIELAVRLRRGLNVVIGEVGTGKTTICRQLFRRLSVDIQMETHLILDPTFNNAIDFLSQVAEMISGNKPSSKSNPWQLKEIIKNHLFQKGIEDQKIVSLLIDEGQKLSSFCIEILREFLNYETNDYKLLQIVVFAQEEFVELLVDHANFSDRINFFSTLRPLNFQDTRLLIQYRLTRASGEGAPPPLFTWLAHWVIYRRSRGYPRKIIHLCHQSLLAMIIQNKRQIDHKIAASCARRSVGRIQNKSFFSWQKNVLYISIALMITGLPIFFFKNLHRQTKDSSNPAAFRYSIPSNVVAEKNEKTSISHSYASKGSENPQIGLQNRSAFLPFTLGTITAKDGENLNQLIKLVHGRSSAEYIESLLTLNPHVKNLGELSAGTTIQFPAISVEKKSHSIQLYRLELGNYDNLSLALKGFKELEKKNSQIRFVAYWNSTNGLRFSVAVDEYFSQRGSAVKRLKTLTEFWGERLALAEDWQDNTLFFSYLSNNRD